MHTQTLGIAQATGPVMKLGMESFGSAAWLRLVPGWWFGTWLLFFHILGRIISIDFHIFQRGRAQPPASPGVCHRVSWDVVSICLTDHSNPMIPRKVVPKRGSWWCFPMFSPQLANFPRYSGLHKWMSVIYRRLKVCLKICFLQFHGFWSQLLFRDVWMTIWRCLKGITQGMTYWQGSLKAEDGFIGSASLSCNLASAAVEATSRVTDL